MSLRTGAQVLSLLAPISAIALVSCGTSSVDVLHTPTTSASGAGSSSSGAGAGAGTGGEASSSSGAGTFSGSGSGTGTGSSSGAITDGGSSSCKRGMAYGYDSVADLTVLSKGIGWWYNWAAQPDNTSVASAHAALGVEYVPMAWGQASLATLASDIPPASRFLLGFNEPNFGSQANLTPAQAASLWPQVEAAAKAQNLAIVSPAVNYCGSPCNDTDPFDWLDQFFAACPGCKVDYIAMHWYACTGSALTSYLQEFESKYTQPLWLTEFSCLDGSDTSEAAQETYMQTALPILEADPRVYRYAWFTGRSTSDPTVNLLGADGTLTPLGAMYVGYPQACKP